jgi:hypothetical protein
MLRRRLARTVSIFLPVIAVGYAWGCARQGRPTGGPQDRIPPMVVSTWPDTFATVEPTRDPIVITFSERISERPTVGRLDDVVVVSPETGQARVKHTRSGLEISLAGGLRPGLVYRVRVLNTVKDMFNNPMEGPFELVFSTGGAYELNVLAGVVTDRITGEKVDQARVEAREITESDEEGAGEEPDVPVYLAKTDTAGIFVLRYIPSGEYELTIYQDNNRNREPDFRERQGTTTAHLGLLPPRKDTIISEVALLQPDTIPARLVRVEAEDSTLLRLTFDDFLPTPASLSPIRITLSREEGDSPGIERLLWPHQLDSLRAFEDSVRVADSLALVADSLRGVADSLQAVVAGLEAVGDTVELPEVRETLERLQARLEPPEREEPEEEEAPPPPPPILPEPEFFAFLRAPLVPNQVYQVTVTNVRNINGLTGGGGEGEVTWEPPEPTPADTAGALPDSLAARPDTTTVPPDTTAVPPDTTGALPGFSRFRPVPPPRGRHE